MGGFTSDFFVYTVPVASIAPGVTVTIPLMIQQDSDFEWVSWSAFWASNASPVPNITLQAKDTAGKPLFSEPVILSSVVGGTSEPFTGIELQNPLCPFVLPESKILPASSLLQLQFKNIDPAETYTKIYVALIGQKIKRLG